MTIASVIPEISLGPQNI